jgi:chaperone LolA
MKMRSLVIQFILFINVILGQTNPVELLKSVQNRYKSVDDLTVNFTQTVNSSNPKRGKLFFKQTESYRIELSNQIIISDGKTFWNYNKNQNKVIIDNFQKSNDNIFSINYLLYEVPSRSNVASSSDGSLKRLILNPKEASFPYRKIELWVGSDYLIKQVIATDNTGSTYEILFEQYELNKKLNTDLFGFNASKGIKVIDLR